MYLSFLLFVVSFSTGVNSDAAEVISPATPSNWLEQWEFVAVTLLLVAAFTLIYKRILVRNKYVAELTRLKESLEKEKYLVDFLMDNIPVSIYFKDKESRFIRVSKYMADYFNKNVEDVIGKTDFSFQDEAHAREAFSDEGHIMRTRQSKINYLEKEIRPDGSQKWVTTTKMPLFDQRGRLLGTFGISKDVSEVKIQNEELLLREKEISAQRDMLAAQNEELIQSQEEISAQRDLVAEQIEKLQEARFIIEKQNEEIRRRNETLEYEVERRTHELIEYNHQLEQFAFISAHNLRAPVARILGLGNVLELSDKEPGDQRFIYDKIISVTRDLDRVVRDLNTILQIKKDNTSVISEIDLDEELQFVKVILEKEIVETGTEIHADFSKANVIYTVKAYLDSILTNLISNAIKYRYPNRRPVIQLKTELRGNYICLIVRDNGLGINLRLVKDKMFTLYSRFHDHVEGKGLGLYLVKTQITALGGKIEIDGEVNKGMTFYIYLKIHLPKDL